jgi:DNA-binding response OmpR family regulator
MTPPQPAVLILDDDEATRDLYRREVGRVYRVVACSNEREVLGYLRNGSAQVIVVEPAALQDEEWSFIAALRSAPDLAHTPIILCSTQDTRRRGVELGVAATLIKPATPAALLAAIDAVLLRTAI